MLQISRGSLAADTRKDKTAAATPATTTDTITSATGDG